MPATVLIAAPEHLATLKKLGGFDDVLTFDDSDALQALDEITRRLPTLVVLEHGFAGSSRGGALMTRLRADPALTGCEIRVLAADGRVTAAMAQAAPTGAVPVAAAAAPLDQRGTRRAPRFRMAPGIEVMVDGKPATLVDLSVVGAHVVSPTILKPNQRVRVSLPDVVRPLRFSGGIAWAAFEMPKAGPRYRAGIEFFDADPDGVGRFLQLHKEPGS